MLNFEIDIKKWLLHSQTTKEKKKSDDLCLKQLGPQKDCLKWLVLRTRCHKLRENQKKIFVYVKAVSTQSIDESHSVGAPPVERLSTIYTMCDLLLC